VADAEEGRAVGWEAQSRRGSEAAAAAAAASIAGVGVAAAVVAVVVGGAAVVLWFEKAVRNFDRMCPHLSAYVRIFCGQSALCPHCVRMCPHCVRNFFTILSWKGIIYLS
jgi:hypothetical protein